MMAVTLVYDDFLLGAVLVCDHFLWRPFRFVSRMIMVIFCFSCTILIYGHLSLRPFWFCGHVKVYRHLSFWLFLSVVSLIWFVASSYMEHTRHGSFAVQRKSLSDVPHFSGMKITPNSCYCILLGDTISLINYQLLCDLET